MGKKQTRKQYSEAFKRDAVRVMQARGTKTVEEVAQQVGVEASQLYRWQRKYGDELENGGARSESEREEVERLRRRLRELEQENTLLKKASALFAKEVK